MSLLDSQIAKLDDMGDTTPDASVPASSGFGVAAPASTTSNSIKPSSDGTDTGIAAPAPAPSLFDAATSQQGGSSSVTPALATTNFMGASTTEGTDATAAPTPQAANVTRPLATTNAAAPAPSAYTGGTSYNDAIQYWTNNGASSFVPSSGGGEGGSSGDGSMGFTTNVYPQMQQAQTDFINAIKAGQDTGVSVNDFGGLGIPSANEIIPQNDLSGKGFDADPLYGSTQYGTFAQNLGQSLGLSQQQVAQVVGGIMAGNYQNSLTNGKAPFELGNSPLGTTFTNALYAAAGKMPDPDALAAAGKLDSYYAQLRAVPGTEHGIFGDGFGAFLAGPILGGVASYLAPLLSGAGEAAGALGGAADAAGDVGSLASASGDVAGAASSGVADAAATGSTVAGGAAQVLDPVVVTGSQALLNSAALPGAVGGAVGTAASLASNVASPTPAPAPSPTQNDDVTTDADGVQHGAPVEVTGSAPVPDTSTLNLSTIAATPFVAQLLQNVPPLQQLPALQQLQSANLNPDQSKWSLSDWQTYLKIASGIAGLLSGSGGGSSTAAASPAAGSIQVPTTSPFGTPAASTNTTGTTNTSLMDAANGLQLPTVDYSASGSGGSTPGSTTIAAAAPATNPAATPAGYTAGSSVSANLGVVAPDQTVADNLTKLLASSSPYVDQARQRAIQQANARGLQNSTLAGQSGEEAAISQALPIAQQDASTYEKQSLTNQAAQDTAAALNENIRQSDNATGVQQASLMEQQRQFDATQQASSAKLAEDSREFNLDEQQKAQLAQLDTNTKTYLANVQAQYQTQMQTSQSATDLYKDFQDQVATISTNANMDAANKQAAINLAASNLKNGMAVVGKVNGLDLSSILQFQGDAPVTTTAAPAANDPTTAQAISNLTPQQQTLYQAALANAGKAA